MNSITKKDVHEIILSDIAKALKVQRILKTGSRLFGDASDDSDYDFVILNTEELGEVNYITLEGMGFECCGVDYPDSMGTFWRHTAYKSGSCSGEFNVNIISTTRAEVYFSWLACGKASLALNLSKEQRKTLFNTIIDEGLDGLFMHKEETEQCPQIN
jgi:hypothetical protein